ncbi:MAG TPA: spore germination protein, partial [Candidatus Udaeobacter sp.]|nr:spore germination protein [Candidatus Udaeobacter sp.]
MGNDLSGVSSQPSGNAQSSGQTGMNGNPSTEQPKQPISVQLDDNLRQLEEIFAKNSDIVFRRWSYGPEMQHMACSIYFETLMQGEIYNYMKASLQDLVTHEVGPAEDIIPQDVISFFEQHGVSEKKADILVDFHQAVEQITFGNIVIFFNQWNKALVYKSMKVESRQITEPTNESVVQGPRESTVENLKKNIGLLRMRLSTPNFKIQSIVTGGETHTQVVYGYVEGAVDSELLKEFESRVQKLSDVEVLETAYIEQLIEDSTWSPFPQHRYTERPDVAVAAMLEGK